MGDSDPSTLLLPEDDASNLAKTDVYVRKGGNEPERPKAENVAGRTTQLPRIDRYLLLQTLGEGGMGVVYAAYDEELERKVAVKVLHPSRQGDSKLRGRILREAQALARVSAPNVVHVYQCAEAEGRLFIAMEFVNGTTLTRWQAEPGRTWQEILAMYRAAGQGLQAAHETGLVHRDFKPDNVLIGKDNRPRVADFGLVRIENEATAGAKSLSAPQLAMARGDDSSGAPPSLTQAGVVMGTPLYMSPEQHLGDPTDSRSDQFSFCVALFEALYKKRPFAGNTHESVAFNTVHGRVQPRPADSKLPSVVHQALVRGLSANPAERWPSMRELLTALAFDPAKDRSAGPRSRRRVTAALLAVLVLATIGMKLLRLLGISNLVASLATGFAFFTVFVVLTILFRRELGNAFHRGTLVYGLGYTGHVMALRVIGMLLGLSYPQVVTIDLMTLSVMSGVAAAWFMPGLWVLVPLAGISAVAAALLPQHAETISSAVMAVTTLTCLFLWNRAVGARRRR